MKYEIILDYRPYVKASDLLKLMKKIRYFDRCDISNFP